MTSTPTRPVDNVVIATKGLQDRNTNIIAGTTVGNKGKLDGWVQSAVVQNELTEENSFRGFHKVSLIEEDWEDKHNWRLKVL